MTQQVKYFAECLEKLTNNLQKSPSNESLPYGIPGSSRVPGSQEGPIILSSDEDIKIKVEKFATIATSEMEIDSSKPTKPTKKSDKSKHTKKPANKPLSKRAKEKAPVRTSSSSSSSDNSSVPFYFKKEDMPKSLREALRVNKDITY